ncbi:MAG: hypothetical protein JWQ79_950 [Mucilaginibacter sp.]|nr:hypothetical protein [Mucilaginibacter sp.]
MVDSYFKRPVFYDYLIAFLACGVSYYFYCNKGFNLPNAGHTFDTATGISTIALTLAGFILTLLTVLITFKMGAKTPNEPSYENIPLFDLFFSTNLYFQTIDLLKGCIKSLIFVSVLGFSLKILLSDCYMKYLFFSNILGLIIITMTLWRSLLILTKIIDLQKNNAG